MPRAATTLDPFNAVAEPKRRELLEALAEREMTVNKEQIQNFTIQQEVAIAAPIETAWEAILDQLGPKSEMPDGTPFPFKLEAWPGGRMYRDIGNNAGHLWGHVQVIKPPKLLEI